jgi:hypothetical protein
MGKLHYKNKNIEIKSDGGAIVDYLDFMSLYSILYAPQVN